MRDIRPVLDNALSMAQAFLAQHVEAGDVVVDATMGNGYDTEFLARLVSPGGSVFAFDTEQKALEETKIRISTIDQNSVFLVKESHEFISRHVPQGIKAAVFNLGYLPGGDRQSTTVAAVTVRAVANLLPLLGKDGIIVIVVYRGHEEGKREWNALVEYGSQLPRSPYSVSMCDFINQPNDPPGFIGIQRRN